MYDSANPIDPFFNNFTNIEKWLSFNLISDEDELRLAFSEASKNILSNQHNSDEGVFFKIDSSIPSNKLEKFEKLLEPVGGTRTEGGYILNPSGFLERTRRLCTIWADMDNFFSKHVNF